MGAYSQPLSPPSPNRACAQLTERIVTSDGRGIVALSVEKLLGTDQSQDGWGVPDKKFLVERAKAIMNDFIKSHHKEWLNAIDIRILGVIIDFKYKGFVADHNDLLTRGYETALVPICSARTLQFKDSDCIKALAAQVADYAEQLH